jgi:hypothetical protein
MDRVPLPNWTCEACTLGLNTGDECAACETPRPESSYNVVPRQRTERRPLREETPVEEHGDDDYEQCNICMEPLNTRQELISCYSLPNGARPAEEGVPHHWFHLNCAKRWVDSDWYPGKIINCPVCRVSWPTEGWPNNFRNMTSRGPVLLSGRERQVPPPVVDVPTPVPRAEVVDRPPDNYLADVLVPDEHQWSCEMCTLRNNNDRPECEICGNARPALAKALPLPTPLNSVESIQRELHDREEDRARLAKEARIKSLSHDERRRMTWERQAEQNRTRIEEERRVRLAEEARRAEETRAEEVSRVAEAARIAEAAREAEAARIAALPLAERRRLERVQAAERLAKKPVDPEVEAQRKRDADELQSRRDRDIAKEKRIQEEAQARKERAEKLAKDAEEARKKPPGSGGKISRRKLNKTKTLGKNKKRKSKKNKNTKKYN